MKLSIICVNWNSTDICVNLLDSLKINKPSCDYEFILVDNNSDDFHNYNLNYENLVIIENKENNKYAKGNNQGLEIAKGEYILFLNPDIKIKENSIDILIDFLDKNKDIFAVCPKLILPNGETDKSIRGFPYPFDIFCDILKLNKLGGVFDKYRQNNFDYNKESFALQPMTSALLVRKNILDKIGYFDEDFPIFFNDVDLLFRANKEGYLVKYIPQSEMDHIHGGSTKRANRKVMQYNSYTSLLHFYEKHFKNTFCLKILIKTMIKIKNLHP